MRWVSNKESVRKGEPSVLAIAETLMAMGLVLWFAVHFGNRQTRRHRSMHRAVPAAAD